MGNSKYWMTALLALSLAACGGSGSKGTAESKAQASAVSTAVGNTLYGAVVSALGSAKSNPRTTSFSGSHTVTDVPVTCTAGGTASVSGSLTIDGTADNSTANVTVGYDITPSFSGCKALGSDGKTYTLDGSLTAKGNGSFDATFSQTSESFNGEFKGTNTGTISVSGGDVSVTDCEIDLTSTSKTSLSDSKYTRSGSFDGTVCGAEAGGSYNVSS